VADDHPGTPGRHDPRAVTLAEVRIGHAFHVMGRGAPAVARDALGVDLPVHPNTTAGSDPAALWMGPASWLVIGARPATSLDAVRAAFADKDAVVFDVSAGRVAFGLGGPQARAVLAAGCPLDLHPRVFPAGACAQSVHDRVNVIVVNAGHDDVDFVVLAARSFGRDVWHGLGRAAEEFGYGIAPARPWPGVARRD
jgi:sarcosine oxidase subunit gamma